MLRSFDLCREISTDYDCVDKRSNTPWSVLRIYAWSRWDALESNDLLTFGWLAPNGDLVAEESHPVGRNPASDYRSWSWIVPEAVEVSNPYGIWRVRLSLNGRTLQELEFEVVQP